MRWPRTRPGPGPPGPFSSKPATATPIFDSRSLELDKPQAVVSLSGRAPNAKSDTPKAPDYLTEFGTEAWDQLAPLYHLAPHEIPEFAAYCEAISEFHESTDLIGEGGLITVDPQTGMPVPSALTVVRNAADRRIAAWAARFKDNARGR